MSEVITGTDFHQWTIDTAEALREHRFTSIDWDRVAEEIQSLGRAEQKELRSRLTQLMYHLLKTKYQPARNCSSWERTIRQQRKSIASIVKQQPSLKPRLQDPDFWNDAYADTVTLASSEQLPDSVVDQFPEECPFTSDILA